MKRHVSLPAHPAARRGAFLVVMLVCLLVAGLLLGALLKLALLQSRQMAVEQAALQAEWLADSGLERAASRLAGDGEYAGETWQIGADRLGGLDRAVVTIQVRADSAEPGARFVSVSAVYPAGGPVEVRRTRTAPVAVRSP